MTSRPPRDARGNLTHHLVLAQGGPGLDRHPADGWQLAAPYPLGPRALRAFRALVQAVCPSEPAPRSAELDERVETSARILLAYMHPTVARGLALGLLVLDLLPVLTFVRRHTLHRLTRNDASALLARWARSRVAALRLLVMGVRSLVLSVYFDQSEVHRAMHYAPVPFLKERIRLRVKLMAPMVPIAAE